MKRRMVVAVVLMAVMALSTFIGGNASASDDALAVNPKGVFPITTQPITLTFYQEGAVLETNDEAVRIANLYIKEQIIPFKYGMDGMHIALATVNDLDMIISMNFQHIVKRKTKIGTGNINALNGYRIVEIYSPMEVVENDCD